MPVEALRSIQDNFDHILRHVRPKRLIGEMARVDKAFYFRHFKGYNAAKIGRGRLRKIADKEIFAEGPGHELFANLLIIHWNNANGKMYEETVAHVQTINEDVEKVERIDAQKAHAIIDDMLKRHDRTGFLLCVRLNGVRFDEEVIQSRLVRGESAPESFDEEE